MAHAIAFNRDGYDPCIDYLKAYAIICVVVGHALPIDFLNCILFPIYGSMQVPLFVLVQVFHAYKKEECPKIKIKKLWSRIVRPFLIIQTIIIVGRLLMLNVMGNTPITTTLIEIIKTGGVGPGSYYIWVYLQIAFILPFLWPLFSKYSLRQLLFPFVFVCICIDLFLSFCHIPEWLYRLTAFRYFFLIYLGMVWVRDGIIINNKNIFLSILTIIIALYFYYTTIDLEPIFFSTDGWKTNRWICYFYVANILAFFVCFLYRNLKKYYMIDSLIKEIAKSSYEIFLIQMGVFTFVPPIVRQFVDNSTIQYFIIFTICVALSICLGIKYRKITSHYPLPRNVRR